jgi:hypothetical protein
VRALSGAEETAPVEPMTNNPADQPVIVDVDFHLRPDGEHTLALVADASGDISAGRLVLATDGEVVLPAIVDEVDEAAGTMRLTVLREGQSVADQGTQNLRLSRLSPEARARALRIMYDASQERIARLRGQLEGAPQAGRPMPALEHDRPGDATLADPDAEPEELAAAWASREYRLGPDPDPQKQALVNALWIAVARIQALKTRDD